MRDFGSTAGEESVGAVFCIGHPWIGEVYGEHHLQMLASLVALVGAMQHLMTPFCPLCGAAYRAE